jgi:uncharacterized repeat protein (TIGR01451 family)
MQVIVMAVVLFGVLWKWSSTEAATYTVTTTADAIPAPSGSLRWAIEQANSDPGSDTIEFAIPTSDSGFNGTWWTIILVDDLPAITYPVVIDGTTQAANVGDTNPGTVGTGGTVGVDELPLPTYERPEIEIDANGNAGIVIQSSDVTIRGLAIIGVAGLNPAIEVEGGLNVVVEGNFLGVRPDGTDPGSGKRNEFDGVAYAEGTGGVIRNNYIGYNGRYGINLGNSAVETPETLDVSVEGNEIFANGWNTYLGDNISVYCDGATIRGNLIRDPDPGAGTNPRIYGAGIELRYGAADNLIENNTISRSLTKGIIADTSAHGNTIRRNVIRDTQNGPGIVISSYGYTTGEGPEVGNRISENSLFDNGGLGIDLCDGCGSQDNGNGVTYNDGAYDSYGPNKEIDYPVITTAVLNGNTLHLEGYIGPEGGGGDADFAGATVEFFLADAPTGYGEGKTFLGSCTADSNGEFNCDLDVSSYVSLLSAGAPITATSTDSEGNTSEFGPNRPLQVVEVDLELTKTVDNSTPNVGDTVTFTVVVTNVDADDAATGVEVEDRLPAGLNYVSHVASQGTYDPGTGVWELGTVGPGSSAALEITATVAQPGSSENCAEVTACDQPDVDSTPDNGDPNEDDMDCVTLQAQVLADLSLTKSVTPPDPLVGETVVFTVEVRNEGPCEATGVEVTDLLPSGYSYVSHTTSQGSYNPATGVWAVGSLGVGATATLTLTAEVNAAGDYTNWAEITASDQEDPDSDPSVGHDRDDLDDGQPDDDEASVGIALRPCLVDPKVDELHVDVDGNGAPSPGDIIRYTVVIENVGTDTARDVVFTDTVDPHTALLCEPPHAPTATVGTVTSCDPGPGGSLEVEIGEIAPGGSVTIVFYVEIVDYVERIANQGLVKGSNFPDDPTDDPDTSDPDDPTVTELSCNVHDLNGDCVLDIVDVRIAYRIAMGCIYPTPEQRAAADVDGDGDVDMDDVRWYAERVLGGGG